MQEITPLLEQFYDDLLIPNTDTHIGRKNEVQYVCKTKDDIKKALDGISGDTFYLSGVNPTKGKSRASDEDIIRKNGFYLDWDVRKSHPDYSDQQIKDLSKFVEMLIDGFRYIVFSGNGLHIHFMGAPIEIQNKLHWKLGLMEFIKKQEENLGEDLDSACVNLSRLARLPGSQNCKTMTAAIPPKSVDVLVRKDISFDLRLIESMGAEREKIMEQENKDRASSAERDFPDQQDQYHAIESIPVGEVMVKLTGWTFDGRNFFSAGDDKSKACFVSPTKNVLIHGGTDHLDASKVGYGAFALVKAFLKLDNAGVFRWFREEYPHIADIPSAQKAPEGLGDIISSHSSSFNINDVFTELEGTRFEQLILGENFWSFDKQKFLIRGAVTRIGAFSNIGKSKMAYFLTYRLLHCGYKGMIFSTEVPRSIVLANLLNTHTGEKFWDIMEQRYKPTHEVHHYFRNLRIYDVTHTDNSLAKMEAFMQKEKDAGERLDFIVVDFVQAVTPKRRTDGEYGNMSQYALEIQAIAQKFNIAVIDLSQISNEGLRDEYAAAGHIPFKGSGHLYSSADIGILLKRDKRDESPTPLMTFDIRKHKYLSPTCMELECDFSRGTFKVFG